MSTPEEILLYNRLRRDVGASDAVLSDEAALLLFEEAAEDQNYPDDVAKQTAFTRVLAIRGILADSAKLGKYAQNQHQEDFTKVFDNLSKLLEYWENQVMLAADPLDEDVLPFFFGLAHGTRGL